MSGALLKGARGLTEDVDLWFENLSDPRLDQAAGGFYMPDELSPPSAAPAARA